MIYRNKHIAIRNTRQDSSRKISFLLACAISLFLSNTISAQVINNNNAVISVTPNTVVVSGVLQNSANTIENDGTIELSSHFINQDITDSDGLIRVEGDWTNTGTFNELTGRVEFRGDQLQALSSTEFGGETFHSLVINKDTSDWDQRINIANSVFVTDSLNLNSGIVNTKSDPAYVLDLQEDEEDRLTYNEGSNSRIVGKFERGVAYNDKYLFPVGSDRNYNPLHLDPNVSPTAGSVLSEFIVGDPGITGLPIPDAGYPNAIDSVEIYDVFNDGYWGLTARNGFSSSDFDMDMKGTGFRDTAVHEITRIIKRPSLPVDSDWIVDGAHLDGADTTMNRLGLSGGISSSGNHFAFGIPRPRFVLQPNDTTECDSASTYFNSTGTGANPLEYQWFEKPSGPGGWTELEDELRDEVTYSGTNTPILTLSPVYLRMHGYQYRLRIKHRNGHVNWSDVVDLRVDELPDAFINGLRNLRDTICSYATTDLLITAHIPISEYRLADFAYGAVTGSSTTLTGPDRIQQTLTNISLAVDSVRYTATPVGAGFAQCVGHDAFANVLVNPTPRILSERRPLDTLFCNGNTIDFDLSNFLISTTGELYYDLDLFGDTVEFDGHRDPTLGLGPVEPDYNFANTLSHGDNTIREISFRFDPFIKNAYGAAVKTSCYDGIADTVSVKMVPVLSAIAFPDTTVLNDNGSIRVGGNPIQCFGESNGATNITVTGGEYRQDYHYIWKDSITEDLLRSNRVNPVDRLENQPAGIYTFEITDSIGCYFEGSYELTQPEPLIGIDSVELPLCADGETGNIFVDVSGGIEGYDYYWLWEDFLIEPDPFDQKDLISERAGDYIFTLTDTNNCVFVDKFTIEETDALETDIWSVSEPSRRYNLACVGDSDGFLSAKTVGQTATHPVSYTWFDSDMNEITGGPNDSTITGLTAGEYYAYIVDANGCVVLDDSLLRYEIKQPDSIHFEKMNMPFASGWDISCFGYNDGVLDLNYTGGNIDTLTNTFAWSTLDGSGLEPGDSLQSGLTAGAYTVSVTDFLLCTADTTITLLEAPEFQIDLDTSLYIGGRNIRCFEEANGYIYVNTMAGGGTTTEAGEYLYNWTAPPGFTLPNGVASEDQDNLIAGTYGLTITDQLGCDTSTTISLFEPDVLVSDTLIDRVGLTSDKNGFAIQCFGDNNGEISLIPTGGSRSYSYSWFDSTRSTAIIADTLAQDLYQGIYSVIITDANACDTSYRFTLNQPDTIVLNPIIDSIYCFGGVATIHLNPVGGNGSYTYLWEDGSTASELVNFPAGTYGVEVTDANNCTIPDSLTLVQNAEIIPVIEVTSEYNGRDLTCFGAEDGIVQVNVEPSNRDYDYTWSNGVTGDNFIDNIGAGAYSVAIIDQYGCDTSVNISVVNPPQLTVLIEALDPLCFGIPTGEITLFPEGGTPFPIAPAYTFDWENPTFSGDQLSELPEGDYSLSITDVNNCQIDTTISLIEPDSLVLEFETSMAECRDEANGSISITLLDGGTPPYTTEISGTMDEFFDYLVPADYLIVMTDANGCIREDTATVLPERESCLDVPNAFTPNGDGSNDTWILDEDEDGTTDMLYYPEAELRIYNRWGVLIYYTANVAGEPWDGTYNGRDMPIDSYHYILDLNNGDPPVIGNVTIVR